MQSFWRNSQNGSNDQKKFACLTFQTKIDELVEFVFINFPESQLIRKVDSLANSFNWRTYFSSPQSPTEGLKKMAQGN